MQHFPSLLFAFAHFSELWSRAYHDSLEWFGGGGGIVATVLIFVLGACQAWKREGRQAVKNILVSGLRGAIVVCIAWALILVTHLIILSPKALNEEKQREIDRLAQEKSRSDNVRGLPWVSMELEFSASGADNKITQLYVRWPYHNTGAVPAIDTRYAIEINGTALLEVEGGNLGSGESRRLESQYLDEAAAIINDNFVSGKFPIKCDVKYRDLTGANFEISYEWKWREATHTPGLPKVELKGEYLKLRRP